jgi:hypothetical protein
MEAKSRFILTCEKPKEWMASETPSRFIIALAETWRTRSKPLDEETTKDRKDENPKSQQGRQSLLKQFRHFVIKIRDARFSLKERKEHKESQAAYSLRALSSLRQIDASK